MKKKILMVLLSAVVAATAAACADSTKGKGNAQSSKTEGTKDTKAGDDSEKAGSGDAQPGTEDAGKYVKLGEYMGLKVSLSDTFKVTKKQIDDYAQNMAEYYAEPAYKDTDKKVVEDGDVVNIDYVGKKDGVAFDRGSAKGQHLTIGSDSFIDGFEDGLIGKKVGQTVDLDLTFPENYQNEELAGADVVFTVKINKIEEVDESVKFKLDDAFVKKNFNYDTVDEYKENVKNYLKNLNESNKATSTKNAVIAQLQQVCEVSVPEELLKERVDEAVKVFEKANCVDGKTLEDVLNEKYQGMKEEDFRKEITTETETNLKTELILEAIAQEEGIKIEEDEFNKYVQQMMSSGGYETEEAYYEANGTDAKSGEQYVRKIFTGTKALDLVAENADVKYGVKADAS